MDSLALIQAAKTRRAAQGLVARNGIACPTQEWVEYYNFRDSLPRDNNGMIRTTPALAALKAAAIASTKGKRK